MIHPLRLPIPGLTDRKSEGPQEGSSDARERLNLASSLTGGRNPDCSGSRTLEVFEVGLDDAVGSVGGKEPAMDLVGTQLWRSVSC